MCDNFPDRRRCDICRTINLAKEIRFPPPDLDKYGKCTKQMEPDCGQFTELPLQPTCIKVCTKEEYKNKITKPVIRRLPHYVHGKLLYAIKAGILVGTVYFTTTQGVWGDQQDVTECLNRWKEYVRSIHTRRPPTYDYCGKVVIKESVESLLAPIYGLYKNCITTCFIGVVKVPVLLKCAYFDYLKALEKAWQERLRERLIKRAAVPEEKETYP